MNGDGGLASKLDTLDAAGVQHVETKNFAPRSRLGVDVNRKQPGDWTFRQWASQGLVWLPDRGMGWYPVEGAPYDADYFAKYQGYAATDQGIALTRARMALVTYHAPGAEVIDVGIGCGQFVETRGRCAPTFGYDVNPAAIDWLRERGLERNPLYQDAEALTFWDSLEHIPNPEPILRHARRWAFVAIPIFRDCLHVLASKHFRPDEHCWYFTLAGLVGWMAEQGFAHRETRNTETLLGREDIASFAFERVRAA